MKEQYKKRAHRFNFALKVYNENGYLLGITKNISSDGCFLQTQNDINRDKLSISIELPGELGTVNMDCKVVRNEDTGLGTKLFLEDENRKNFSRIIENVSALEK
tara:strand:- start:561 stop:872 length:312 start_codon:yes stop_codon:yes gene_type:complete